MWRALSTFTRFRAVPLVWKNGAALSFRLPFSTASKPPTTTTAAAAAASTATPTTAAVPKLAADGDKRVADGLGVVHNMLAGVAAADDAADLTIAPPTLKSGPGADGKFDVDEEMRKRAAAAEETPEERKRRERLESIMSKVCLFAGCLRVLLVRRCCERISNLDSAEVGGQGCVFFFPFLDALCTFHLRFSPLF